MACKNLEDQAVTLEYISCLDDGKNSKFRWLSLRQTFVMPFYNLAKTIQLPPVGYILILEIYNSKLLNKLLIDVFGCFTRDAFLEILLPLAEL